MLLHPKERTGTSWRRRLLEVSLTHGGAVYTGLIVLLPIADKKRAENGKGHDSDDSDRPKKKAAPKANGKSKGRA